MKLKAQRLMRRLLPSDRDLLEAVDASLRPGSASDPMISSLVGAY